MTEIEMIIEYVFQPKRNKWKLTVKECEQVFRNYMILLYVMHEWKRNYDQK